MEEGHEPQKKLLRRRVDICSSKIEVDDRPSNLRQVCITLFSYGYPQSCGPVPERYFVLLLLIKVLQIFRGVATKKIPGYETM